MQTQWVLPFCLIAIASAAGQHSSSDRAPAGVEILKVRWTMETPLFQGWDRPDFSTHDQNSHVPLNPAPVGPFVYDYLMKIKNSGTKEISALAWDYRISEWSTDAEIARYPFWTRKNIRANQTVTLKGKSSSPPPRALMRRREGKNNRAAYAERAVIKCVLYADGTLWRGPAATDQDCERLKTGRDSK